MKKFLNFIILSSVALLFNGCISGWGWLVPYNLQPSYHKFKKMCKLNELPNNEEKYNKILGYFDLSLDTLDWEELNGRVYKLGEQAYFYLHNYREYSVYIGQIKKSRYNVDLNLYSYQNNFSKNNITSAIVLGTWHTRRYFLDGNEGSGFYWSEEELRCSDLKIRYNPKE
ncbi:hypothetical protein [Helicobacter trogontum]|uniref:hypothetical protein n=1 Tax=Helicobacter trogontum TaxID=50960 RepID=UPI000CF11B21|nr:hypothetical protein [Helicobacter trogontum]